MKFISILRSMRHGVLKRFDTVWVIAGRLYRWAFLHLRIFSTVEHKIGKYGPFKMDGIFAFSNFANWGKEHNNGFQQCIETSRGKSCVFDIGAHIGLVTLPLSSVINKQGRVFAFEPASANLCHLKNHLSKNNIKNVVVIEKLVGKENKKHVTFFESSDATGMNSIVKKQKTINFIETKKQQISIDDFCQKNNVVPEVMKIDVEGAEIGVLKGCTELLKLKKTSIFLSVHPNEIQLLGNTLDDLNRVIFQLGYECCEMDGSKVVQFRLAEYLLTPKK